LLIEFSKDISKETQKHWLSFKDFFSDEFILKVKSENDLKNIDWKFWLERAVKRAAQKSLCEAYYYDYHLDESKNLNIELSRVNSQDSETKPLHITFMGSERALFLDRDGIINKDDGYVSKWDNFIIFPEVVNLAKEAIKNGMKIIIVTNQSGIARNLYTLEDLNELHHKMLQWFEEKEVHIERIYHCPYHKDGEVERFKRESLLRKPRPGMALMANMECNIDIKNSLMIGDKKSDRLEELDMKTFFIQGNYDLNEFEDAKNIFSDLKDLKEFFISNKFFCE
tara:strand:+ start:372336 stop:373181 length:846 start_codon:yes stop_codon:yes gene_type:complete